jgi:Tn3 transposase DDE domain
VSGATPWPAPSSTASAASCGGTQVGQENQLDSLGIMINVIVLWQTVYTQAALDHLAAKDYPIDPADVARLTPLGHPTINLDGRYRTTNRPPATGLRPG